MGWFSSNSSSKKNNWIRDSLDYRDYLESYKDIEIEKQYLETNHIDLRNNCPGIFKSEIKDSVACSIASIYEFYKIGKNSNFIDMPSRLFMYYTQRILTNSINEDIGSEIRNGLKAVNIYGFSFERLCNYDKYYWNIRPDEKAFNTIIKPIYYFRLNQDIQTLKYSLFKRQPFIFGCCLYNSYLLSELNNGIIIHPYKDDELYEYKAFMCVGFDDEKKHFIIRNNKGLSWGDKGYCYLPYSYILNKNFCADFWTFTI